MASARALLFAVPGCSWRLLAAPRSSLGPHGSSWRLLADIHEAMILSSKTHVSLPTAILNVSHEVYSGSLKIHATIVLLTSGAKARKSSTQVSCDWFSVGFWSQDQKVLKSSLLGQVFSTSGAKDRESSNRASYQSVTQLNLSVSIGLLIGSLMALMISNSFWSVLLGKLARQFSDGI